MVDQFVLFLFLIELQVTNLERDEAKSKSEYALVPEFIRFLIVAANFRRCGGLGFRSVGRVSGVGEGERCIILLEAVFVAGETVSAFPII